MLNLQQWLELDAGQQLGVLADAQQRQAVLQEALPAFARRVLCQPLGEAGWLDWLDFLALAGLSGELPSTLLQKALQRLAPALESLPPCIAGWPDYSQFPEPQPLDIELDLLNQALDNRDLDTLAPLARSMAEEADPRQMMMRRLSVMVAADNHANGERLVLADHVADLQDVLPAPAFTALFVNAAYLHFQAPAGPSVVVPEGKVSLTADIRTPLLVALRERNLQAYMHRLRALGDDPIGALRQLLLAFGLLILERGIRGEGDQRRLAMIYLRLVALLKMHHSSRRLARRAFFAAAVQVFELAGWTHAGPWPDYAGLLHAYQAAAGTGKSGKEVLSWETGLHQLRTGAMQDWMLAMAGEIESSKPDPLFWNVWGAAQRARVLTAGPLAWINALIPLRLYGDKASGNAQAG